MKWEEHTEFLIDWGEGQQLHVTGGIAMATNLLRAGPLPVQVGTRSTSYMALGQVLPSRWMSLFDKAAELGTPAIQVELEYVSRVDDGFVTQRFSLSPCEHGEHLHASVVLFHTVHVAEGATVQSVEDALYEAWRAVGDRMSELQDEWIHPCLEHALDLEALHGGQD